MINSETLSGRWIRWHNREYATVAPALDLEPRCNVQTVVTFWVGVARGGPSQ